jgi:hypothetical protein
MHRMLDVCRGALAALAAVSIVFIAAPALAAGTGAAVVYGSADIDGHHVQFVRAKLDEVKVLAGLGQGLAARTESLAGIAQRYHAIAAINGGYFEAYYPGPIKNLNHTVVSGGTMVFKGDIGDIIYFDDADRAYMDRIPLRISGGLDGDFGYPNDWYAYWFNRYPENAADTVTIFTPAWGTQTGIDEGPQVQVTAGVVTMISPTSTAIPPNGYVIYFHGEREVAGRFRVGRVAEFRIERSDHKPLGAFADAQEAIGCGPRLVTNGAVTVYPAQEGFRDPKVLYESMSRSMVGYTKDGWLIMATSSGTTLEMGRIMQALGAWQAMSMDSGASSGLWLRGRYLVEPGRLLNNALLVVPRR